MTAGLRAIYFANIKGADRRRRLCLAKSCVLVPGERRIAMLKLTKYLALVRNELEAALSDFLAARFH